MRKQRINKAKALDGFAVLWLILSSNSLVYCILNMKLSMAILAGIACLYLCRDRRLSRKNLLICTVILLLLAGNMLVNFQYATLSEDLVILLIRLCSLVVIMSNLRGEDFVRYYVYILLGLAVISIFSFGFSAWWGSYTLPFQTTIVYNGKYYIYTFYHTLGRWSIGQRNCGIFWEPGGYQIYLNLALLFLWTKYQLFLPKWGKGLFIVVTMIFVLTILSTFSTTGFLCLALVMGIGVLHSKAEGETKRTLLLLIVAACIALAVVESRLGIIESKAIQQQGSYGTRFNDTTVSISLGLQRPFGYGYMNTYAAAYLKSRGVSNNSSGLGGFMICFGAPMTVLYLGYIGKRFRAFFQAGWLECVLLLLLFLLFIMSESVFQITIFLSFLFVWDPRPLGKGVAGGSMEDRS